MELDGANSNPVYETSYEPPAEPPPSDPPPEPVYQPPVDVVESSSSGSSSADASAAAWAEGTIAAAEAYAAQAPRENEFAEKTPEEKAQDAFWKNDPNRPQPPSTTAPTAPPPQPAEDDTNTKHPGLKPEESTPPSNGPVEPLPSTTGPVPAWLQPKPEAPTPPHLQFPNTQSSTPSTPPLVQNVKDFISSIPYIPTRDTTPSGTPVYGVRTNPGPTPPSNAPPEKQESPAEHGA